jgi:hypothetical protein
MSDYLTDKELDELKDKLELRAVVALLLYKLYSLTYTEEELQLAEDVSIWYKNYKLSKA